MATRWLHCVLCFTACLASGAALAEAPVQPPTPTASPPGRAASEPVRYRLANGLRVVLAPQSEPARVAVALTVQAGASHDPAGYHGLAHLTEHAMFEGRSYQATLERAGLTRMNACTLADRTTYFHELPATQLDVGLELEATRFGALLTWLDAAMVERAREAVTREFEERQGDHGASQMWRHVTRAAYPEGHPYRDHEESQEDIAALGLREVQWFFQTYYRPDNATLSIVGAFDEVRVRERIEALFGPLRAATPTPLPRQVAPVALDGEHRMVVRWRIPRRRNLRLWLVPQTATPREDRALDVLAGILDEQLGGMAYASDTFLGASAVYQESALTNAFMLEWVTEEKAEDREAQDEGAETLISELRRHGPRPAWVAAAKKRITRRLLLEREDLVALATRYGDPLTEGETREQLVREYEAVTAAEVHAVAERYLSDARRVVLHTETRHHAPDSTRVKRHRFRKADKGAP